MGERPEGLTLDRLDVMKDYCPTNCEWVDNFTQGVHRRKTSSKTSSEYKGVCFKVAEEKYVGTLVYQGKRYHLGYSDDPAYLARKYDTLLISLSGSDEGTNAKLGYLKPQTKGEY